MTTLEALDVIVAARQAITTAGNDTRSPSVAEVVQAADRLSITLGEALGVTR
ncbi:hypothetical protein [Gordonia sp. NB41Y]|uniref:hypothetical protein n=1 Tax=Gordonia sp. NB41Y TaxID=875808 RepID=UPI000347A10D|nr:hypothetical protein [Gordonia sp. NB41Y]WLP91451.1 hypothetical protein Q9K23_04075 [Gordonia sp. NB41Y]